MAFVTISGFPGKVYAPEQPAAAEKKHVCPDCYACQMCSDDRCRVCRRTKKGGLGHCCRETDPKEDAASG